jgi:hypothetical protein
VMSTDNRPCMAIDFEPAPFPEYDRLYDWREDSLEHCTIIQRMRRERCTIADFPE